MNTNFTTNTGKTSWPQFSFLYYVGYNMSTGQFGKVHNTTKFSFEMFLPKIIWVNYPLALPQTNGLINHYK